MRMLSAEECEANRANAQKSTGPKTPEGKAISSQNGVTHGLTGRFSVGSWEDQQDYEDLLAAFHADFLPASQIELELVASLAQHHWLIRRAIHLQNRCFVDGPQVPTCLASDFALYLRYQTTHERAFHKVHATLSKIKADKEKAREEAASAAERRANGFASQKRYAAAETRKQQIHEFNIQLKQHALTRQSTRTGGETRPAVAA